MIRRLARWLHRVWTAPLPMGMHSSELEHAGQQFESLVTLKDGSIPDQLLR